MTVRRLALIALSALVLVGLGTYLAGERIEVVVLRTYDAQGAGTGTKMWVVDYQDRPYVRIGRPGRGWGERLEANPKVELVRGGVTSARTAVVVQDPEIRRAIDAAFAAKYGWIDWWFGVVLRKDPQAVRLDPRE